MPLELMFSIASVLAMVGWIALLATPFTPVIAQRVGGFAVPLILSLGYLALAVTSPPGEGGFGSLAEVGQLFAQPAALLAGWVHYLAFDLLVGAWICRIAHDERINFWFVVPCLVLTFLLGPIGFVLFFGMRLVLRAVAPKTADE